MYKVQNQQKELTELKLNNDLLTTTNDSLLSELTHTKTELKETKILYRDYEFKWKETNDKFLQTTQDYQDVKRSMITYDTYTKERDDNIALLKDLLEKKTAEYDE